MGIIWCPDPNCPVRIADYCCKHQYNYTKCPKDIKARQEFNQLLEISQLEDLARETGSKAAKELANTARIRYFNGL